ncbi:hypothetical protein SO802_027985 [Lithocarpus litseifolius]|uniref:Uncharacterized protein n=1 Tax=Lithocarpus litseifolius TaxID=425828 RepID=A0AAW2BR21_9ROSI
MSSTKFNHLELSKGRLRLRLREFTLFSNPSPRWLLRLLEHLKPTAVADADVIFSVKSKMLFLEAMEETIQHDQVLEVVEEKIQHGQVLEVVEETVRHD